MPMHTHIQLSEAFGSRLPLRPTIQLPHHLANMRRARTPKSRNLRHRRYSVTVAAKQCLEMSRGRHDSTLLVVHPLYRGPSWSIGGRAKPSETRRQLLRHLQQRRPRIERRAIFPGRSLVKPAQRAVLATSLPIPGASHRPLQRPRLSTARQWRRHLPPIRP
jgi:hypothetical protein